MESESGGDSDSTAVTPHGTKSYLFSCKANAHPVVSPHFAYFCTSRSKAILPTLSSLNWMNLIHQELFQMELGKHAASDAEINNRRRIISAFKAVI